MQKTVGQKNFPTIVDSVRTSSHVRLWSVNRNRPCPGTYPNDDTCSVVPQQNPGIHQRLGQFPS